MAGKHRTTLENRRTRMLLSAASALAMCASVTLSVGPSAFAQARGAHMAASGGNVVVADTSSVQKLDPDVVTNFLDFQALGLVYDQLVQYGPDLALRPDLATKWTYSNGNKVLTFQLRRGVKFHDGTAFTSAAVVQSLQRALAPKTGDASASFLANVKKIVATGPYSVQFRLSQPDTSILDGLTSVNLSILSPKAIAAGTLAKAADGTGPFEFSSWSPNNSFVIKRNPNYWGGKVKLASVKIETVPSEQSIASAVEANTAQIGLLTQPQIATHLPSSITTQKVLDLTYRALMLQDKTGPLANVDNRLAIACALNRQSVVNGAVFGAGKVVGPVPLGEFASKPVSAVCPTPNLALAKSYLQKAGNAGGFSFTAITSNELDPTSAAQATVVQSDLAQVGIKMSIQNLAGNAYVQDWLKGKFQAAFAWNGADPNPYTMYGRYFGAGANLGVPAGYSSPVLQKLLQQGDTAASMAKQKSIWAQLSKELTSQAVWIWLFTAYDYAAVSKSVHGFVLHPTNSTSLNSLASASFS